MYIRAVKLFKKNIAINRSIGELTLGSFFLCLQRIHHLAYSPLGDNVLVEEGLTSKHTQQLSSTDATLFNCCQSFVLQPVNVRTVTGIYVSPFPGTNMNILHSKVSL